MRPVFSALLVSAAVATASFPVAADEIGAAIRDVPIFDTHMHYNRSAWKPYPVKSVIELMDRGGVEMALVSSTPNDGTLKLLRHAPARFVAELRPYYWPAGLSTDTAPSWLWHKIRKRMATISPDLLPYDYGAGKRDWTRSKQVQAYLRQELDAHPYEGVGEFHLHVLDGRDVPQLEAVARMAKARRLPIHVHAGAAAVRTLFALAPDLTIIWAHAGWENADKRESVEVIGAMFDTYPNLYADTSYRERDILTEDGSIAPGWRDLILKNSRRLMIGTDTWTNSRWDEYQALIDLNRRWLSKLPRDVAERIAFRNAERLFGRRISQDPHDRISHHHSGEPHHHHPDPR